MNIQEIDLNIDYNKAGMESPCIPCLFTGYILHQYMSDISVKRPAIIILPGGAYKHISPRESMPVATEYLAKGFSVFILSYTVSPNGYFPCALLELFSAIQHVRNHAEEYGLDPNRIYVCGFSAGGHAAACSGVFWNHQLARSMGFINNNHRPDALILCYPVITSGLYSHKESFVNLLGEKYNKKTLEFVSLEDKVTKDTPRTFIWHTAADESVPVQNTLMFVNALVSNGIETEVHIYPRGEHGLSTARFDVLVPGRFSNDPYIQHSVPDWISDSVRFLNA